MPIAGPELLNHPKLMAERILNGNVSLFSVLAKESAEAILLRIPVEAIEPLGDAGVKNILNALENTPNIHIELFYATGFGEAGSRLYKRYGLNKALPDNFTRTRENTITLLYLLNDKDISLPAVRMRLGDVNLEPTVI